MFSFFFLLFPLRFPADCYGCAATVDSMNDTLLPPGMWTILVSLQNKFNLHFFLERGRSVFLRERGAVLFTASWTRRKLGLFLGCWLCGSNKQSLLNCNVFYGGFFFSYFVLLLAKVKELMCSKLI